MRSTVNSLGTSSGCKVVTSNESRSALDVVNSRARLFGSIAYTVACGDLCAKVSAIGPAPQPISTKVPCGGGGGAC